MVTPYWIGYLLTAEMTSTQVQVLFHAALEDQGLLDTTTGKLLGGDGRPLQRGDGDPPILVAWSDNGPEMTSTDTPSSWRSWRSPSITAVRERPP